MHKHENLPQAFADIGIEYVFLKALAKLQFVEPSDIQKQLIPLVLSGRDVLGQARTGTGKTAAFGLPVLQKVKKEGRLQAIILVPTRELATQVAVDMERLCDGSDLHIVPVYGGQRISHQLHALGRKPHIVVGTPGRVIDFLERRALSFDEIRFVVLDEVDRMLDIGFRDDIRNILSRVKNPHQTVLVSATLTDEITRLAKTYMNDPVEVNVSRDEMTVEQVNQSYVTVEPWDKFTALRLLLQQDNPKLAIIFCNTKRAVDRLASKLRDAGLRAVEIHGDLIQRKRERAMDRFRSQNIQLLVATDLASRGIDVRGITHIINYDTPDDPHSYVHRIGRTARMGSCGDAIAFVTREQGKQLTEIEMLINKQIVERKIEGFVPRPPRETDGQPYIPQHAPATVAESEPAVSSEPARSRGLGAKFKPSRRRRL